MRIGIKLGSKILVVKKRGSGLLEEVVDRRFLSLVCEQIVTLIRDGHQVFLVTSGAVASDPNEERPKSVRAAVGGVRLLSKYRAVLSAFNVEPAQILVTARDLDHPADLCSTFDYILKHPELLAVVNANDTVDGAELRALGRYADNDQLFSRLCELLKVDQAIIGFDCQGVLDRDGKIIRKISTGQLAEMLPLAQGGNSLGHGKNGMNTKMEVLSRLAGLGIEAKLVPAREPSAISRAVKGEKDFGTIFIK